MTADAYFCSTSTAFSQKHSSKGFCVVGVRLLDLQQEGNFITLLALSSFQVYRNIMKVVK